MSALLALNLNPTLGALEIGVLISTFLFGVATLQAWIYYQRFPNDRIALKALVAIVWLLQLGHTICDSHGIYIMTVTDYAQPEKLLSVPQSINAIYLFTGLITTIVQAYYAHRVRILTGKPYITIACWAGSLTLFVISLIGAIQAFQSVDIAEYAKRAGHMDEAGMVLSASIDLVITLSLCYYFIGQKSVALGRTARILDDLMVWTIQTGLLTSLTAIATIATFCTLESSAIWLAIFILGGGLYANSLFALLNARTKFRNAFGGNVFELNKTSGDGSDNTTISIGGPKFARSKDYDGHSQSGAGGLLPPKVGGVV